MFDTLCTELNSARRQVSLCEMSEMIEEYVSSKVCHTSDAMERETMPVLRAEVVHTKTLRLSLFDLKKVH